MTFRKSTTCDFNRQSLMTYGLDPILWLKLQKGVHLWQLVIRGSKTGFCSLLYRWKKLESWVALDPLRSKSGQACAFVRYAQQVSWPASRQFWRPTTHPTMFLMIEQTCSEATFLFGSFYFVFGGLSTKNSCRENGIWVPPSNPKLGEGVGDYWGGMIGGSFGDFGSNNLDSITIVSYMNQVRRKLFWKEPLPSTLPKCQWRMTPELIASQIVRRQPLLISWILMSLQPNWPFKAMWICSGILPNEPQFICSLLGFNEASWAKTNLQGLPRIQL